MAIDHCSSAGDMLAALARREISPAELAELHIARIDAHDGALNAIPLRTFERARERARIADARLATGAQVAHEWHRFEARPGYS